MPTARIVVSRLEMRAKTNFRALHGKFTGKAYHGYTVVASYHIPYSIKTVQFSENRTISTIYHFVS